MPEGPSVVILKEQVRQFKGKKIISVTGNSKIEQNRLKGRRIIDFKSWGKHFLICLEGFALRIHFLMWGSYTINEHKDRTVRLNLSFKNGFINFYSCSVKIIEGDVDSIYDFSTDVMSESWDEQKALTRLYASGSSMACDVLLNQEIFSGVGNIIKNEVLYRIRTHPESLVVNMPDNKLKEMIREARNYSFDFYEWKRRFELKKHWQVHTKKICPRCNMQVIRKQTGTRNRRSFFCLNCQEKY